MYEEISDSAGSDSAIQNNSAENISVSVKSAENTLHDSELINIFPELANLDKYDFDRQTEIFEQILKSIGKYTITDRTLWLINPHYETKFGMHPLKLPKCLALIPYVRNFFTTSCFYVLGMD